MECKHIQTKEITQNKNFPKTTYTQIKTLQKNKQTKNKNKKIYLNLRIYFNIKRYLNGKCLRK